ncbi:MAG: DUF1801 domain-containing protein [Algibacter sp.]|uniref:DUF1801 domain-containing protein n=1 Tax=Algibacter sp. TaxID=1872428 RepID=UPI002619C706|nr:DUF1801 domain-containing protein [Algibacter sp.]MDG1728658.1 DUF1801 domain-containing protein [Algibacter sp.]MDG2177302.1 DUF1801 domain-containing protein [Algibacter sp.]
MLKNENFYISKNELNKSCLLTLRGIILKQDNNITETKKYGMPCFCYKKKMFCYLWVNKKTGKPYILFVEGEHLNHSELVMGTRKRMKIFRVNPNQDIPIKTIELLLNDALELYRNGIITIK